MVSVTDSRGETTILLAPISSKAPCAGQAALPVLDIERRRAGLTRHREAWVYVGEMNQDHPGRSWYLEPQTPLGVFSRSFLSKIAAAAREVMAAARAVNRGAGSRPIIED